MRRRRVLAAAGVSVAVGVAGYPTASRLAACQSPNHQDFLVLAPVSEPVATGAGSVVIASETLPLDPRAAVAAAANRADEYRVCHQFEGEPSSVEELYDIVVEEWVRADAAERGQTYVRYGEEYYGMAIALLDQVPVDSLPDGAVRDGSE